MMMNDRGGGTSFNAYLNMALGVSIVLPVLAIGGLATAIWFMDGLHLSGLTPSWEIFFGSVLGALFITVLIIVVAWSRVRGQLRQQVTSMTLVLRGAIEGTSQSSRTSVIGNDEMANLAASINAVLDMRQGAGSTMTEASTLQSQIEKLLQEVSAVGEGDLSVQAEVTPDTLGVLADSFNYMIEELAKVVGRVQTTTQQVIQATRRIIERTGELARSSEAQGAQVGLTSDQVEEMAAFILSAARNATLSAAAAQEALTSASEGKLAVDDTINGLQRISVNVQDTAKKIKRLGERSQEIGDIVRIIEDLAEQTNLLALNAAIQSAMAGENGRGFAVVSDEIRLLAERSGDAAKKIVVLVKSIQTETHEAVVAMEESTTEVVLGANQADNAGRALAAILVAVDHQAHMVEDIARAANDRTQTSEAVAMAMNRILDITRQTNATMHDTAASITYLAELADQLRASVSTFRLPTQPGQQPALNMPQRQMMPPMLGAPNMAPPNTNTGAYGTPFPPALPPSYNSTNTGGQYVPYEQQMGQNTPQQRPTQQRPAQTGQQAQTGQFGQPGQQAQTGQFGQPGQQRPQGASNTPSAPRPNYGQQPSQPGQAPSGPFPTGPFISPMPAQPDTTQRPSQPDLNQRPSLPPSSASHSFDPWEDEQSSPDGWNGASAPPFVDR